MTQLPRVAPVLAAALSGFAIFFAMGLAGTVSPGPGALWIVALIAPVPVLWFAFRAERGWAAFLVAFAAYALGSGNILPAYTGTVPLLMLVLVIGLPVSSCSASRRSRR
jgi:apolipoprotein N-acyltransferase